MNRNIQFRAKRSDNGEWVYGFYGKGLIDVRDDKEVYRHFIVVWDVNGYFTDHIVDPKTVGQFTGLLDKNGKDIYEGDIVESSHPVYDGGQMHRNIIEFKDFCWRLVAIGENRSADIPLGLYARQPESIAVIGNIYENEELITSR